MDPGPAASGPHSRRACHHRVGATATSLLCALAAASCGAASTASPAPTATAGRTATPGAATSAVEARLLVQQGLAIGLASNVVQSQVTVLMDALLDSTSCKALEAGTGSSKVLQRSTTGNVTTTSVDVYYDPSCAQPYIEAAAQLTSTPATSTISITETATYRGPGGATLGTLQLSESAVIAEASGENSDQTVDGTGTFTPHDGGPVVSLGLECGIPAGSQTPPPFGCSGAVAQAFPALGLSLAAVAPLTVTVTPIAGGSDDDYSVTFAGAQSTSESGVAGTLSVTTPTSTTFGIGGKGTAMSSQTTSGHAALFALFSPPPTGWTVTDASNGTAFALTLESSSQITGSVTTAAGASLAHLTLDQSGSGTITYAGGSSAPVTSWTLGG
jgi:hypothetical protein